MLYSLVASQDALQVDMNNLDLLIHIGEISGEYGCLRKLTAKNVWRVNEDGEMRDFFRRLEYVFEMPEQVFLSIMPKKERKLSMNIYCVVRQCIKNYIMQFLNYLFLICG